MNETPPAHDLSPVTVGWYLHPIEAEIARGMLESAGIPAFLHSVGYSQLFWTWTLALGGIRLQVPASEAELAKALLTSAVDVGGDEDDGPDCCPKCGSTDNRKIKTTWRVAFLMLHVLSIPLPFSTRERKCRACGRIWDK